jgi:hypothetical protein
MNSKEGFAFCSFAFPFAEDDQAVEALSEALFFHRSMWVGRGLDVPMHGMSVVFTRGMNLRKPTQSLAEFVAKVGNGWSVGEVVSFDRAAKQGTVREGDSTGSEGFDSWSMAAVHSADVTPGRLVAIKKVNGNVVGIRLCGTLSAKAGSENWEICTVATRGLRSAATPPAAMPMRLPNPPPQAVASKKPETPKTWTNPLFVLKKTKTVGIVVDGRSFEVATMGDPSALDHVKREVASAIQHKSGSEVFVVSAALEFFYPDPHDLRRRQLITDEKFLRVTDYLESVKRNSWAVKHSPVKWTGKQYQATVEDINLTNAIHEMAQLQKFDPIGAFPDRITLDHIVVVTADGDHAATLTKQSLFRQTLLWWAFQEPSPGCTVRVERAKLLQEWAENSQRGITIPAFKPDRPSNLSHANGLPAGVAIPPAQVGRTLTAKAAPWGSNAPLTKYIPPPYVALPLNHIRTDGLPLTKYIPPPYVALPPDHIRMDGLPIAEADLAPTEGITRARSNNNGGKKCAKGDACTYGRKCHFLHPWNLRPSGTVIDINKAGECGSIRADKDCAIIRFSLADCTARTRECLQKGARVFYFRHEFAAVDISVDDKKIEHPSPI